MQVAPRITLLILLPNLNSGGGQRIVLNFLYNLDRTKFRPLLLVQERLGAFLDELERVCDPDEFEFLQERPYKRTDLPGLILKTIARARSFDLILGGLEGRASTCGLLAAKVLTKPFVGWIHIDWRPFSEEVSWRQILALRAYKMADQLVACSAGAGDNFSALFDIPRERITTIMNMIPCDAILYNSTQPLPPEHEQLFDKPVVLAVGRLEEQKGYPHLVQAHRRLIEAGIDHNLVIIGEGSLLDVIKDQVAQLGLDDTVHFLGFQKNPHRYMARATVFTLSSEFEGFGLVLAEALMCSAPVVATDCLSGPSEVLSGGEFGLLVPPKDPESLAGALAKLLCDPDMRRKLSVRGPERARQFDQSVVDGEWQDLMTGMVLRAAHGRK
jgi:glycosyltransferase involved in cell wall biosynthesis